ncbi:unnamed protein product, partial [Ectocarpus sp. 4 AP-2014]
TPPRHPDRFGPQKWWASGDRVAVHNLIRGESTRSLPSSSSYARTEYAPTRGSPPSPVAAVASRGRLSPSFFISAAPASRLPPSQACPSPPETSTTAAAAAGGGGGRGGGRGGRTSSPSLVAAGHHHHHPPPPPSPLVASPQQEEQLAADSLSPRSPPLPRRTSSSFGGPVVSPVPVPAPAAAAAADDADGNESNEEKKKPARQDVSADHAQLHRAMFSRRSDVWLPVGKCSGAGGGGSGGGGGPSGDGACHGRGGGVGASGDAE